MKNDLTNQRFTRLVAKRRAYHIKCNQAVWLCLCDCGNETFVKAQGLKSGNTKSCGCLRAELSAERKITHGLRHTKEYQVHRSMLNRFYNPKCERYDRYGGRGIMVCESWKNSVAVFVSDIGMRPPGKHSIERINNDGNYEPGNCRWATKKEQSENTSRSVHITYKGETLTLSRWARRLNMNGTALAQRIKKWGLESAMTRPKRINRKPSPSLSPAG